MPKPAPPLPSHLSYKSALVLLPPASVLSPIERFREKHDRNFHRWPPHINLIYPFLARPSQSTEAIRNRISQAVHALDPIEVQFRNASYFRHGESSATVYLEPVEPQCANALIALQALLQSSFPECNADGRDFTPHLSVGQARGSTAAGEVMTELDETMRRYDTSEPSPMSDPHSGAWSMGWTADRVYILERRGFRDRFKVVDEVIIPGSMG